MGSGMAGIDLLAMVQNRNESRAFVTVVMNFPVPYKAVHFSTS
jgi:hypothetical protein